MIKVYHMNRLTNDEVKRLNASGWDSEAKFTRYADVTSLGKESAVKESWRLGEYSEVAEVNGHDLEIAFERTNHIDRNWVENADVVAKGNAPYRSTSVGDIMEVGGKFFVVASFGFAAIEL